MWNNTCMRTRVQPDWALETLLALAAPPATEEIPLRAALGRVCAADVFATLPNPPFARSAFDGFALRTADIAGAAVSKMVRLRVSGELAAGSAPQFALEGGCAVKILTGAPVPAGADAVVPRERVQLFGDSLLVSAPAQAGENITPMGEDVAAGERLACHGDVLDPTALGLLAGQGLTRTAVYRLPRIALICTGSELVPPGEPRGPAQIYNTNAFTIGAYLEALGAAVTDGGTACDESAAIASAIEWALAKNDAVFLTGGASLSDYDCTLSAIERLGGRVLFHRTAMRPGGAMLAAEMSGKAVVGLSGNPAAAVMGLLRVAAPYVKRLGGRRETAWPVVRARLMEPVDRPSPQIRLMGGHLRIEGGELRFFPARRLHDGAGSDFADCDLIGEIPAGSPPMDAGEIINAYSIMKWRNFA